jgi:hypothetical protein
VYDLRTASDATALDGRHTDRWPLTLRGPTRCSPLSKIFPHGPTGLVPIRKGEVLAYVVIETVVEPLVV